MAWSTPMVFRNSRLLAEAVPMTRAPAALAICTAAEPTPPAAPWINTLWPLRRLPASCNARYAVSPVMGTPAACSKVMDCRSEEHTSELQSRLHLVCRLLLEKKKKKTTRPVNIKKKKKKNKKDNAHTVA